jgi:hypothetical protein
LRSRQTPTRGSGAAKLMAASYGRDYTKGAPNFQKSQFMENSPRAVLW